MENRIPKGELTAFHEAGHAVAIWRLRRPLPQFVTIDPFLVPPGAAGFCQSDDAFVLDPERIRRMLSDKPTDVRPDEWRQAARQHVEECVVPVLAGYAAEQRRQDLEPFQATARIVATLCSSSPDTINDAARVLAILEVFEPDHETCLLYLFEFRKEAQRVVLESWPDIQRVATALLERKTLQRDEIVRLLTCAGANPG